MASDSEPGTAVLSPPQGLSAEQVRSRVRQGLVNDVPVAPVRTVGQIVRNNVLTPVNGIIGAMFVLILVAGFPGDALFAGVVVSNSVIGIVQELKARHTLNRLAVLSAPRARVVRDGVTSEVDVGEVVSDEVLELRPGDQVIVDGDVLASRGLEIDESLLTGESDPIAKSGGDPVMSGSFVNAGAGWYQATAIGADCYAARLASQARRFKLAGSELRGGVNVILRWLTVIIPPAGLLLLLRLLGNDDGWEEALRGTVAAAVAMVPDGLVLLTSLSFITGVVALARRGALARELASVELLARVDTLCLDKTGTITTGEISFSHLDPLGAVSEHEAREALFAVVTADPAPNATLEAVASGVGSTTSNGWHLRSAVPFSSARKWAATSFEGRGTYHLGAGDILLGDSDAFEEARMRAEVAAQAGNRVLVLTHSDVPDASTRGLPEQREPICLVCLNDTIRPDAPEIFSYFRNQGVDLKVISGDHPATVAAVARRAGIINTSQDGGVSQRTNAGDESINDRVVVSARDLPEDADQLADTLQGATVFGRVNPHQKRAMVHALQSRGHTVAMTGDGVNDVLALKDADMGIAMGTGSSAARAVAQLVLLDNRFATLPRVLAEGRRVINNIERVANLFIVKAAYAVLLTLLVGIAGSPFPFLPRHLTLIGTFSVGVPGFFLALAAADRIVERGFLGRVLRFALPTGAVAGVATFVLYEVVRRLGDVSLDEARTSATVTLLGISLVILVLVSRPLRAWKVALAGSMGASYALTMIWSLPRDIFSLHPPSLTTWLWIAGAIAVGGVASWLATEVRWLIGEPRK